MASTKKKKPLVCKVKGNAEYNDKFSRFVKSPCECTCPLKRVTYGKKQISLEYYMAKSKAHENGVQLNTKPSKNDTSQVHLVVPCDQLFVKKDSKGTRLLQRWTGDRKFPGCQAVENDLIDSGEVNNENMDILSKRDILASQLKDEPLFNYVIVDPSNLNISESIWVNKYKWVPKDEDYPFANIDHMPFFKSKEYKKVPYKLRRPLELYYLKNPDGLLTMRDIAKKMRIPLSTLHNRMQEGKEALREAAIQYSLPIRVENGEFKKKTWVERLLFAIFNPKLGTRDDF
jgi:hypothetical protein